MFPSKEIRCESENQPGRGPYNEDRTKKRPHIGQGPEPLGWAGQYQIVSHTLRCLDGSQVEHEAARIFACEPECRHIGMTNHEPFAQSVAERIEIHPAIESTERRRSGIWALAIPADGVTFRAQSLSESLAVPLQGTRLVLRGKTRRCSEQQKQAGKPCHHLDFPASVATLATMVVIVTPASFERSTAKNGSRPEGAGSTEPQSPIARLPLRG